MERFCIIALSTQSAGGLNKQALPLNARRLAENRKPGLGALEATKMKRIAETVKGDRVVVMRRGIAEAGTVVRVKKDGTRTIRLDDYSPIDEAVMVDVRP